MKTFDRPFLILCEGMADKQLFHKIVDSNPTLHGIYSVLYPRTETDSTGGRGKFGGWLENTHKISSSFRSFVKAVLIVSDADESREESLNEIKRGLERAGFPVPANEREIARADNRPAVAVVLIPIDGVGNIETICSEALAEKWQLQQAVEDYIEGTPAKNWGFGKKSKAKMHSLLSVTCETKPQTNLADHWQENEKYHVPIDGRAFVAITDTIIDLSNRFRLLQN